MIDANILHYGFRVHSIEKVQEEYPAGTQPCITTLTLKSLSSANEVLEEQLISDLTVMNRVRESNDPAVLAAYEQMLTVMALTKDRVYEDDNGTLTTKK